MLSKVLSWLDKTERRVRYSFGDDITDPVKRRWSAFHYHIFDHAFLRTFWTNFDQVAPGVYRSNQPTHARFEKYAAMGIKTVINLRGEDKRAHYLFEVESCEQLGLTLVNAKMWARNAPARERIVHVIDTLRTVERPMMFHCKSGADRAGFVSAMYLMIFEGVPVEVARNQLSLRYLHLKFTKTGVQDYMLDVYAARNARAPISFEEWIRTEYDNERIQEGWDKRIPAAKLSLA